MRTLLTWRFWLWALLLWWFAPTVAFILLGIDRTW